MAGETPKIKVNNDCNEKLRKIDDEISKAKSDLERFENSKSPEVQSEVENAKKRLADLERQREEIITETQSCLAGEKVGKAEIAQVQANLDNTNLSGKEKAQVRQTIESEGNSFDVGNVEQGGIIGIIIAILQALLHGTGSLVGNNEYSEADPTETPGRTIRGKERTSKDKENFINEYKDLAKQMEKESGIPWEFTLSQAGLESGWGTSGLSLTYNNFFGIKADSGWKGKSVILWTPEEKNRKTRKQKEPFRVYESVLESFRDHAKFLKENPRYQNAFNYTNDPTRFALEIARAGYATDSGYAGKLTSTIKGIA